PIEPRARVLLAARGDVFMPCDVGNGVTPCNVLAELCQRGVLRKGKKASLQPLHLNANRVVIALRSASVGRLPRMPGAQIAVNELPKPPYAVHKKMCRHFQPSDAVE